MRYFTSIIILVFLTTILNSCARGPYAESNRKYKQQARAFAKIISKIPGDPVAADSSRSALQWIGTTNFNLRKPNYVVIHHTAQQRCEQTLQTFTQERTQVSAHYVICKDGTLHHMLNDYFRAWHAGAGKWGNETDVNSASIGIEIDNNGVDSFSTAQLNTLEGLLALLKKNYNIPAANFIGHADIAPARKTDPSILFPWRELAESGFGLWYGDTTNLVLPTEFNVMHALRIIGYDITNLPAATQAFRRHFLQADKTGELEEGEKKVLYALMQKYL